MGGEDLDKAIEKQVYAADQPQLQEQLQDMTDRQSRYQKFLQQVEDWERISGQHIEAQTSEHGYPVLDLTGGDPATNLMLLRILDRSEEYVYHGMQNNEFRRAAGMPEVDTWESLDPSLSHQAEGRKRVYATRRLDGGLTHALIEHRFRDANPNGGQTYALKPLRSEDGRTVEFSPALADAMGRGEVPFVDGLLYILPSSEFEANPDTDHEVVANHQVYPVAVVRVGKEFGPLVVQPDNIERQG